MRPINLVSVLVLLVVVHAPALGDVRVYVNMDEGWQLSISPSHLTIPRITADKIRPGGRVRSIGSVTGVLTANVPMTLQAPLQETLTHEVEPDAELEYAVRVSAFTPYTRTTDATTQTLEFPQGTSQILVQAVLSVADLDDPAGDYQGVLTMYLFPTPP